MVRMDYKGGRGDDDRQGEGGEAGITYKKGIIYFEKYRVKAYLVLTLHRVGRCVSLLGKQSYHHHDSGL